MNITFIGGGNMARALIGGLLAKGHAAAKLRVVEIDAGARAALVREFGVSAFERPEDALTGVECVLLAVKPQKLRAVAATLAGKLGAATVVSIAAGIRSSDLTRWLGGHAHVVRAMPNTPALVHAGVSGLYATPGADADDRARAEALLGAVGRVVWLGEETLLDAVTAVSGSGPAYVFYFIEALEAAGRELGLDAAQARALALGTFEGAAKLAAGAAESPAELRARVTSKGGTTEAALASLTQDQVAAALARAVRAAADRSRALGDELGRA
jgi:pyrroline-5-carboxylate reductase